MKKVYEDTKNIVEYGLFNFMKAVMEAKDQGYEIDFESNDHVPQVFGSLYEVVMVKEEKQPVRVTEEVAKQIDEAVVEEMSTSRAGRKKKEAS